MDSTVALADSAELLDNAGVGTSRLALRLSFQE
jgi:hypothetical protein